MKIRKFKTIYTTFALLVAISVMAGQANGALIGVSGDYSTMSIEPEIIAAPDDVLNNIVTNKGMQGFNEAQGVMTMDAYEVDGGGWIEAGTLVDSHMIFLNSPDDLFILHYNVDWTFSGNIIGVMSDIYGELEVDSTFELGAPGTDYPADPFLARGLEVDVGDSDDSYSLLGPSTLRVNMAVSEPGDWIRVVTVVPVPGAVLLGMLGLGVAGLKLRKFA